MPFLLAEILNFQGSTHRIGVGSFSYGYENTLMVHIRRVREKIEEDPSHPAWLLTVRGLGYKLAKGGKTGS